MKKHFTEFKLVDRSLEFDWVGPFGSRDEAVAYAATETGWDANTVTLYSRDYTQTVYKSEDGTETKAAKRSSEGPWRSLGGVRSYIK